MAKGGNNINVVLGVDTAKWKKDWDTVLKEANKGGQDVEKSIKQLSGAVTESFRKIENSTSLKSASRQMFNLAAALETGGNATSKAFRQSISEAGHLKDRIDDLNALIQVGGPAGPFIAMNNALKIGVAGMNAVQGSMALLGGESKALQETMVKLQAGMALAGALKELEGAKDVWTQLNFIMKQNPALTVAAGISAVVAAVAILHDNTIKLTQSQQASHDVQKKAIEIYATEEANLKALYKQLNTGNLTRGEQQKLINDFNAEHPKLLRGLKTEGMNIGEINGALIARIALIKKEAEAQAARTLYIEEYTNMLKASQEAKELSDKGPSFVDKFLTSFGGLYGSILTEQTQVAVKISESNNRAAVFYETWQNINAEIKTLKGQLKGLYGTDFSGAEAPKTSSVKASNSWQFKWSYAKLGAQLGRPDSFFANPLGGMKVPDAVPQSIEKVALAFDKVRASIDKVNVPMRKFNATSRDVMITGEQMAAVLGQAVARAVSDVSTAIGMAIATGEDFGAVVGKSLLMAMANFLKQLGEMYIQAGTAKMLADIGLTKIGGAGATIAAGAALVAASAAATAKIQRMNQPRAFADGGVIFGPTLGLMGEYAGASANPEIVAPLDRLKALINPVQSEGAYIAETRIDGRDLQIILQRADRDYKRG